MACIHFVAINILGEHHAYTFAADCMSAWHCVKCCLDWKIELIGYLDRVVAAW